MAFLKTKTICFLILLMFVISTPAQELHFTKPAVFQNLPSVETYQALQDKEGNLWITTDAGLCRYDGNTLTTYTVKDGISENVVLKAYEDYKGRLWFSTLSGYFFYYENEAFHPIAANEELKKICIYSPISGFFIGEKDTLFFATNTQRALLKIPPQENYKNILKVEKGYQEVIRFFYTNKNAPDETIFAAGGTFINPSLDSFLVNDNGRFINLPYKKTAERYYLDSRRGSSDKYGNIYCALGNELTVIDKSTHRIRNYVLGAPILFVYQDDDGDLWIGTAFHGGYLYKKSDLNSKPIRFLTSQSVCSVCIDKEGSIWASTLGKGIFKSNSKHVLLLNEKAEYLQKNEEQLLITHAKKIIRVSKDETFRTNVYPFKLNERQGVLSASFLNSNSLFFQADPYFYQVKETDTTRIASTVFMIADEIFKINGDTICTVSPRDFVILAGGKVIYKMVNPISIKYSTQLRNKTILVSSRNNSGLYTFQKNTFIPFLSHLPELKTRINCMVEDSIGNLWIATNERGLFCYDARHQLHHFSNAQLPDKISCLTFDRLNNLWATSNHDLIKIDYRNGFKNSVISLFDADNGIPGFQIEKIIEFNGKLWCSTKENMFYFVPEKLKFNTVPPPVYIRNILVNDRVANQQVDTLKLQYNQNNIRIQSNVITFKNLNKKDFLYKLIGYDEDWHSSSTGDIQYTNLQHGTYQFVLYGLNSDGTKSTVPATITFVIQRPFWYTWWFICLEVITVGILFFLFLNYWKKRIEKREKERRERETEKIILNQKLTEFKMTALRSQMNPHFIFNAIGSIQNYILHNEITKSYDYLSKFALLIRNILNNSRDEYITLSQEISTLKLYVELEQIRFRPPFRFILTIDESLDQEMDIPTMLIQPYVENSIWHGLMPKENGILELTFKKQDDDILVVIKDNGVGRKPVDPSRKGHISKGMSITEQRIQTLGVTTQKKFHTTIIDLKDDTGNSIGTEVQLLIPMES